ncbi:hypothetical protein MNBD_GAMMA11-2841 [hydrothermal vent metagenome]|uniref:TIGR02449 family protein n=1 Tax=hydrothermal vent metagenome TaxID=652676 RepID=A0A3B0XV04_9ZZZZ
MSTENESNIEALEDKIEALLALTRKLSVENTDLKGQLLSARTDRSHLIEQKEHVRTQVEGMISRLKTAENT